MDKLPELWRATPKVQRAVFQDIQSRMLSTWTYQDVWDEIVKSDEMSEDDQTTTFWALTSILRVRRGYVAKD
jgi:hypothetical protein